MIERGFRDLWERLQGKKPHLPHLLAEIHLAGIRGIDDVRVVFDYPVSVIAGGNASGKSTVLFAAACAYKVPGAGVKDFVPSTLFPNYRPRLGGREDERREAEAGSSFRMAARTMVQLRALALTTASCASWSAWMFRNSVMNSRRASHGICRRLSPAPAADRTTRRSTRCRVMPSTTFRVPAARVALSRRPLLPRATIAASWPATAEASDPTSVTSP